MSVSLAAMIISRDGARRLPKCIESLGKVVDKVYVFVDSRTKDDTANVAHSMGAVVNFVDNDGLLEHVYEKAAQYVDADWIIRLDDDEILSPVCDVEDQKSVLTSVVSLANNSGINSFYISRRWILPGETHFISSMFWWPDPTRRMFRKMDGISWPKRIHDDIFVPGGAGLMSHVLIDHYDFIHNDRAARENKVRRYAEFRPEWSGAQTYLYEDYSFSASPLKVVQQADVISAMRDHFEFFGKIERGEQNPGATEFELLTWRYAPLRVRKR